MGINCQEDFVLAQFEQDACSVGANLINIIEERLPNIWSTCYRAKAELKITKETPSTEPRYSANEISINSSAGHKKTQQMINASGAAASGVATKP